MSAVDTLSPVGGEDYSEHASGGGGGGRMFSRWMVPLEAVSALLMVGIIGLLLTTVVTRYVLNTAVVWIDEVVSLSFIWVTMIGAANCAPSRQRSDVICSMVRSLVSGSNCLGRCERERGQSRVPDPPERMTGVIMVVEMTGSMVQKKMSLSDR